ncbi:MAG: hypothetical protein EZS28_026900 [Streblomastix strix]|uniref:Uncharacterized protein n=1 Tax=Streblomastix strix TaxID=222440 RepID=A0A5J4V4V2_9EUKA|nr:MAG: hypothetical protein EZS28_026900 [Streblomastix strix]
MAKIKARKKPTFGEGKTVESARLLPYDFQGLAMPYYSQINLFQLLTGNASGQTLMPKSLDAKGNTEDDPRVGCKQKSDCAKLISTTLTAVCPCLISGDPREA